MTTVDVPGVTICQSLAILHIPTHCMFPIGEACRWEGYIHKRNCMDFASYSYRRGLILLFVQQYRALLTASECESDNGTVHAFLCPKVFFAYRAESLAFGTHRDMDATKPTSDEKVKGGNSIVSSSCAGLTSDVPPDALRIAQARSSPIGVSTKCVLSRRGSPPLQWFALRTTYGRELKAYHYLISQGLTAFCPTIKRMKIIGGKRYEIEESRIPNIFFVHGTFDEVKSFVYDNINLPYLRFYYSHRRDGHRLERTPIVVPEEQMNDLMRVCNVESANTIIQSGNIQKFDGGELVRIIDGPFAGITGRVAKYKGQQRVAVIIDGLVTACTAYVPSAFLERK